MQIPWQNAVGMGIKLKVALIEDDRRLARALANGLGEVGYTVRSANSKSRGLDLVRHWNPDVILLDPLLPDNEGPALGNRFRPL
jgi:DNA-binding response OmpR family regulator